MHGWEWQPDYSSRLAILEVLQGVMNSLAGLMFMPTLSAALGEIYRVLKPSGLLVVTVSKSMAQMPYFKTLLDFCIGMCLV